MPVGDPSRSRSGICLDQQRLEPAALRRARLSGPRGRAQGAQRQGPHRRADLGRSRRLHHHGRRRMHQEPGRRDRRRRLGRRARGRGRQVHRQEGPDRRHRRRPADLQAPDLSRHQLVQSRLPARPVPVPLPQGGGPGEPARSARSRSSPPATSSRRARACATRSPRSARTSRSSPTRSPGTNVEQVAANTAAIIQGHPEPDRHGRLRLRGRPGHRARRHRGRQVRQDHHHLERGRPRLPELASRTAR